MFGGKLSISRVYGHEEDHIRIQLNDQTNGTCIINIKMGMEEFAKCITGLSGVDCKYEVYNANLVGKKFEIKKVDVDITDWSSPFDRDNPLTIEQCIKNTGLEVDGWFFIHGNSDFSNHHYISYKNVRRICTTSMQRFLNDDGTPIIL